MPDPDLAARLLEAQVAFHAAQLTGPAGPATVAAVVDDLLDAVDEHRLRDLVDAAALADVVTRALVTVPGSPAVGGVVELAVDVALAPTTAARPLGEVVAREDVEALLDALLARTPALERALDRAADAPLVGVVAARFVGRLVGEVLETNRSLADKVVPGLGSLVSFGTRSASRVVGAADAQLQGLLGDTAGRGGALAVDRLGRVVVATLRDPTTREAALQAWDRVAAHDPGTEGLGAHVGRDELLGVVSSGHRLVAGVLAHDEVATVVGAVVEAFLERFGDLSPTALLAQLGLPREVVRDDVAALARPALDALTASGALERLIRARLEPFWASPETQALLA